MCEKLVVWIVVFAVALLGAAPALAQEDGYRETFDDPSLPEWEHSREVVVTGGVLKLTPGSYALRLGDWTDITLTARLRFSGEGEVLVGYYLRDEGRYGVLLREGLVVLDKERQGVHTVLATVEGAPVQQSTWLTLKVVVSEGQHQVYVDDALQVTATDLDPLEAGAALLHTMGDVTAEFDDLEVRGRRAEPRPPEGELPPEEPPPSEGEPPPAGEPGGEPPAGQATPPPGSAGGTDQVTGNGLMDEFFASQASNLELATFVINLALAVVCSCVLSLVYIHWGASLTNRRKFAANFYLLTITTTFIILVVRSSIALSLGLVGALSIVRFRTAVKEAEELAYLFFAIGLGIGLGDNQRLITLVALAVGILIVGLLRLFRRSQADVNLHLTVVSHNPGKIELDQVMEALRPHTAKLKLLRVDETPEALETSFLVEFRRIANLNRARAALKALSEGVEITFLDNKGIW
ncbi:MAG: DUF4956 domain-containing protein [Anaerolineae bacterium]|nr:DUF4956 domain-containing protein [Anaerolineae bacterium]